MLRRLHTVVTVVSTLLLVGVLVLWARSGDWNDEFVLRTARSYVTGPRVKRIALRSTTDGVAVSFHVKVTPSVELESPLWREDVPVGGRVVVVDDGMASSPAEPFVKLPYPPGSPWGRPMTPREQSDFEARAQADYVSEPLLRWTSGSPAGFSGHLAAPGVPMWVRGAVPAATPTNPILEQLGIQPYHPETYLVGEAFWPGAHHEVGANIPFPLAAAAAAVLPLSWLPRWVKRGIVRRRLRRGLCPACAYDLRGSVARCPECGWPVDTTEVKRARTSRMRSAGQAVRGLRRRPFAAAIVVAASLGLVYVGLNSLTARGTYDPVAGSKVRGLRRELDECLWAIETEARELRNAVDADTAGSLESQLHELGRRVHGAPADAIIESQRLLADARPVYLRALRSRWDRARIAFAGVRFTGVWAFVDAPDASPRSTIPDSVAEFDVGGPIRRTMKQLPERITDSAYDPETRVRYGLFFSNLMRVEPLPQAALGQVPYLQTVGLERLAFDTRRRQLMLIDRLPPSPSLLTFGFVTYRPDLNTWGRPVPAGAGPAAANDRWVSLTYSEHDDCFYALGWTPVVGGKVVWIARVDPQGKVQWRAPLGERVMCPDATADPPRIAAAGAYLAVLTPPLADPFDERAPPRPRCVLVDPVANTVLYSGAMSVHDAEE